MQKTIIKQASRDESSDHIHYFILKVQDIIIMVTTPCYIILCLIQMLSNGNLGYVMLSKERGDTMCKYLYFHLWLGSRSWPIKLSARLLDHTEKLALILDFPGLASPVECLERLKPSLNNTQFFLDHLITFKILLLLDLILTMVTGGSNCLVSPPSTVHSQSKVQVSTVKYCWKGIPPTMYFDTGMFLNYHTIDSTKHEYL